jgi:hypothetical protein
VTALCGETYRPSGSVYRRAGNEPVTTHLRTPTHLRYAQINRVGRK